ncbi:hypothetical protein [Xanthomonas hortorum]|uniref:hypothetical protein n=1 Tax=Xanthomonas hortorum TaxID=56454 RepID=UPI0032E89079
MKPPFYWDHIGEGSYLRFNYRGIGSVKPDGAGAWTYRVTWQGSEHAGVVRNKGRAMTWMERWVSARRGLPIIPNRKTSR